MPKNTHSLLALVTTLLALLGASVHAPAADAGAYPSIRADWSSPDRLWGDVLSDQGGRAESVLRRSYVLGARALKFTCPPSSGMCRSEFQKSGLAPKGSELVYEWRLYLPLRTQLPGGGHHASFIQWKNDLPCHNSGFDAANGRYNLRINNNNVCKTPGAGAARNFELGRLARGRWTAFKLRVKWHPNPEVGFVKMWADYDVRDGIQYRLAVPFKRLQTMHAQAQGDHKLRFGWYRQAFGGTSVFYGDAMVVDRR